MDLEVDDSDEAQSEFARLSASELQRFEDGDSKKRFELLIFSEAGKPVYSYTKREDAVTLMPLCSALIEYAKKTQKESLQSIRTHDNLVIRFISRPPLVIIVIHETHSYVDYLMLVEQVEAQLISILTAKTLNSVFRDRPTFDLKRLIYGSEKLIDATANLCAFPRRMGPPWIEAFLGLSPTQQTSIGTSSSNPSSPSLPSRPYRVMIPIVIMHPNMRDSIHNILQNVISSNSKNMVFSLLFKVESRRSNEDSINTTDSQLSKNDINGLTGGNSDSEVGDKINLDDVVSFKLISVCNHHDRHKIKIADIHIILALLSGSRAQLATVESLWMPICLPKFNEDAFVHSYIAYMNGNRHCIVMMSIDREEFANCQKSRNTIEDRLEILLKDPNQASKYNPRISPLVNPTLLELHENLIRDTLPEEERTKIQQQIQSLNIKQELHHARQLQFLWYQTSKHVLWWQRSSQRSVKPVLYYLTKRMLQSSLKHLWLKLADDTVFLGWHVPTFQLYAQFDKTIMTNEAAEVIQRITNWIKKEEDNFCMKDYK